MESDYAEENLSTQQSPPREKARIQGQDGDQERSRGDQAPPREGPQASDGPALLSFGLPKEARLAKRAEFLRVYEQGTRIEGRFMTVFLLPNGRNIHRVGVTATKKGISNKAHDRNRAKRLLREAFRLSKQELNSVEPKCDWVLNARRSIMKVKLEKPLSEFKQLAVRVAQQKAQPQRAQGNESERPN